MSHLMTDDTLAYLTHFTSRKVNSAHDRVFGDLLDSLAAWMDRYLILAVRGVRSEAVARKIAPMRRRIVSGEGTVRGVISYVLGRNQRQTGEREDVCLR